MLRHQGFRTHLQVFVFLVSLASAASSVAGIFGTVRGIVHDVQHRPIAGARLLLQAKQADWRREAVSDDNGEFQIDAVPAGNYTIQITHDGFREYLADLAVTADSAPLRHFPLDLAGVSERVEVSESAQTVDATSSSTPITVSRQTIFETPGAARANSLDFITAYTPGA